MSGPSVELGLIPVGVVRSPCRDPAQMPGQGIAGEILVDEAYAAGLEGLDDSSHLVVLGWLHHADRATLRVLPRFAGAAPRGVFATRAPGRPNPISVTMVRLLRRDGARLEVDGLDLVDGTIVLDLKPYMPGQDAISCATRARRTRSALDPEKLAGFLMPELEHHLGEQARSPGALAALGALMVAAGRLATDPRDPALRVRVNRQDESADALMGLLGATLASGRILLAPAPGPLRLAFSVGARELTLTELAGVGPPWDPSRWEVEERRPPGST